MVLVWVFLCLSGAIGAQTSESIPSIPSRDAFQLAEGNGMRFGARALLTVDENCTDACNATFTTCFNNCGNTPCKNQCTANQTSCFATCHHCGNVSAIPDGNVSYSNGDIAGSVATYTCNGGFSLQGGSSTRTCDIATDTWVDSANRSCLGILCAALSSPVNGGNDLPPTPARYPKLAKFVCNSGYKLNGTVTQVFCGWDSFWYKTNGTPPTNLLVYPGDLPACIDIDECALNATLCPQKCTNSVGSYSCDCFPGYYKAGSVCLGLPCQHLPALANGIWNYTVNGTILQSDNYDCAYPCNATLACDYGFAPLNQTMQMCASNLTWNAPSAQMLCVGKLCSRSFPGASPTYTINTVTSWAAYPPSGRYQDTLTITCNSGYTPAGGSFSWTCLGDGTWDCGGACTMPSCVGSPCDTPPLYTNGLAAPTNGGYYPSNITYPCNPGYNQTGASGTYACQLPGLNWANTGPVCSGKFCGPASSSASTNVNSQTGNIYPTTANYGCKPNYFSVNPMTQDCNTSGLWPPAPACYLRQLTLLSPTTLPNTAGTTSITLTGSFSESASYVISSVTFGPSFSTSLFSCASPTIISATSITCTPQASVGGPYTMRVAVSSQSPTTSGPFTVLKAAALSYPAPVMSEFILVTYNDGSKANETSAINLKSTLGGDILMITGNNFGTNPSRVFVTFGDTLFARTPFVCAVINVTNVRVYCTVPFGDGGPFYFRVGTGVSESAGGDPPNGTTVLWSSFSAINIKYPAGPTISRVTGCPFNVGSGTSSCPTAGGTMIAIQGAGFLGSSGNITDRPVVTVAGDYCIYVSHNQSAINCIIPSGTGLNQMVVVATDQGLAQRTLLSYIAAQVNTVTGCLGLSGCSRAGGDSITLTGLNFGACCASVIVGDVACAAVRHDDTTPHTKLTCNLAADKGLLKSIILQQFRGQVTYVQSYSVSYEECQPGTFDNPAPSTVCGTCSPGKYTDVVGMSSCIDCQVGSYQPYSGQSTCVLANASRYVDVRGLSYQKLCPSGTFTTDQGRGSCTPCAPGTYGSFAGLSVCQLCAAGTAQASPGQSSCVACSPGTFADSPGFYQCGLCSAGYVQPASGKTSCTPCYRGKISTSTTDCTNCPVGKYSDRDGLAVCISCLAGFYQNVTGTTQCVDCAPGRFQSSGGQTACPLCAVGKYQGGYQQINCLPCAEGTSVAVQGAVSCTMCVPGTYSPIPGQPACTPCETGRFIAQQGQAICSACSKGYTGNVTGLTVCTACTAGTIAATDGSVACTQCAAGTYSPALGQSVCTTCDLGFIAAAPGSNNCTSCTPGYYADSLGSTTCRACPVGKYSENFQSFQCKDCDVGRASSVTALSSNCPICPAGKFTGSLTSLTCGNCALGDFNGNEGSSTCFRCSPGTFANQVGTTRCTNCAVGKYAMSDGSPNCVDCDYGYYSSYNGTTTCTKCVAGTFAANTAMSLCVQCAPGKFVEQDGKSVCNDCAVGKYSVNDPRICTECARGFFADIVGRSACVGCAVGKYAPNSGASICVLCEPGKYQAETGIFQCALCEFGKFSSSYGLSGCDLCAPGRSAQDAGMNICRDCDPGYSAEQAGTRYCSPCALGYAQNESMSTRCIVCAPGTYADKTGLAVCSPCPIGRSTLALNTLDHCDPCAPGKYAADLGQSSCDDCDVGFYISTPGNGDCFNCTPGTYAANKGTSLCTQCAPGRHSIEVAAVSCEDCSLGREAPGLAASICDECQPGFFAITGASRCSTCAPGTVNNETGRYNCSDCSPGTYSPDAGGRGCSNCVPGRMANSYGQSHCTFCGPGTFSNESSATFCSNCPAGRYQEGTMNTVCFDCGIGTASSAGQAKCNDCPSQTAQPYRAQPACLRCDQHSKQSELKDECVCNPGFYAPTRLGPSEPDLPCQECPRGGDCSVKGTTFANIGSAYGFWRQDASVLQFYQCQMPDYCPGGNVSTCAGFRTGALCGFCLPGYAASGAGGLGACSACVSEAADAATVVVICIVAVVVIFILYYIVLYSDRKLLAKLKERQKAQTTELKEDYEQVDSSAFENFEEGIEKLTRRANQERFRPNPVYKLKIVLGFFQIMVNLAFGISFGWPTLYRKFLMIFNVINMDFFPWGSMSCLATLTYRSKLIIITVTPVGLFFLLICLYVLPKLYRDRRDMSDDDDLRNRRERSRIKFMKLCLFTVFAMFPFISSSVIKLWVCRNIDGVDYLMADMGIRCYQGEWNDMLPMGIFFVLVYPVGIPLTFMGLLFYFRKRFKDPDVRIRLGFIYAAYTDDNWWFELYDIASKLYLTSLVVFFGDSLQYGAVMIWVGIYMIVVLVRKPYITKGDDRLQLFSMLEIYLLVSCAMVFKMENEQMDPVLDTFLSICLMFLTLLIALGGLLMIGRNLRKMWFERKRKQMIEKGEMVEEDELALANETEEEQVLSWATKVRLRAVQLPKRLVAPPKPPPRVKPARPPRKAAVEADAALTQAHRAPQRYGGRVLAAVQNIENSYAEQNAWQTLNSSKFGTRRITVETKAEPTVADPFAPAPGETRSRGPSITVTTKKVIKPSSSYLGAPPKSGMPRSDSSLAGTALPGLASRPSAALRPSSAEPRSSSSEPRPTSPSSVEPRSSSAEPRPPTEAKRPPQLPKQNSEAAARASSSSPRPPPRASAAPAPSSPAATDEPESTDSEPKPKPPPRVTTSADNSIVSSDRPAKPAKLTRQARET